MTTQAPLIAPDLKPRETVNWNLGPAALYESAIRRGEGQLAAGGPFAAITTPHTGRSPKDKFVVREPTSEADIWWGKTNQAMTPDHYAALREDILRHLAGREIFVRDVFAGA